MSLSWVAQTPPNAGHFIVGMDVTPAGTTVIVDVQSKVWRSTDGGVTWTLETTLGSTAQAVRYLNGVFFIPEAGGGYYQSTNDGVTWSAQTPTGITGAVADMSYGGGILVAYGGTGSKIATSSNMGSSWTTHAETHNGYFPSTLYDGTNFVVVSINGSSQNEIGTSTDGFTMSYTTINPNTEFFNNGIVLFGGNYYQATANNAIRKAATPAGLCTASDTAVPVTGGVTALAYDGSSVLMAADGSGPSAYSTNGGTSWTTTPLFTGGENSSRIVYDATHGHFIAVGSNGSVSITASGPIITQQPQNLTVTVGQQASFSVTATPSGGSLSYQWYRNGVLIPGATASQTSIAAAQLSDSGAQFYVIVTDANGSVQSSTATLTVNPGTYYAATTGFSDSTVGPMTFGGQLHLSEFTYYPMRPVDEDGGDVPFSAAVPNMIINRYKQQPSETRQRGVDFTLFCEPNEYISNVSAAVVNPATTPALVISNIIIDPVTQQIFSFTAAGGVDGTEYNVQFTVTFNTGQVQTEQVVFSINIFEEAQFP